MFSFSFESLEAFVTIECFGRGLDIHTVMMSSPMHATFVQVNVILRSYIRADCMHTHSHTGDLHNVAPLCTYT